MKMTSIIAAGVFALTLSPGAHAQRVQLDDSLSPRQNFPVELDWQPQEIVVALSAMFNEDDTALPPVNGYVPNVEIRLNTRDYVNQRVRIYMGLPAAIVGDSSGGDLELAWVARGAFESGSIRPGQEALIFEGLLESPITSGTFDFKLSMPGGTDLGQFDVEPVYELEIIN